MLRIQGGGLWEPTMEVEALFWCLIEVRQQGLCSDMLGLGFARSSAACGGLPKGILR